MERGGESLGPLQAPITLQPLAQAPQLARSASAARLAAALVKTRAPCAPEPAPESEAAERMPGAEQMRACSAALCLQHGVPVQAAAAAMAGVVAVDAHAAVGA